MRIAIAVLAAGLANASDTSRALGRQADSLERIERIERDRARDQDRDRRNKARDSRSERRFDKH